MVASWSALCLHRLFLGQSRHSMAPNFTSSGDSFKAPFRASNYSTPVFTGCALRILRPSGILCQLDQLRAWRRKIHKFSIDFRQAASHSTLTCRLLWRRKTSGPHKSMSEEWGDLGICLQWQRLKSHQRYLPLLIHLHAIGLGKRVKTFRPVGSRARSLGSRHTRR